MAAYAALASLMNNIEQMMKHPHLSKTFDNKLILALLKMSGSLLDIIEGNSNIYGGGGSKEAEDFERRITCAAHAAEDIIESHIVDQIHDHDGSSDDATDEDVIEYPITDSDDATDEDVVHQIQAGSIEEDPAIMVDLETIIEEMEALMGKSAEVMKVERDEGPTYSATLMESGEPAPAMVGLDDELTHLLDELTSDQSNRHTISIVGMGGMGKTTLTRNLYANPLIIEHFDIRAWATVSQQYNEKEILKQLLSSLGKLSDDGSVGELGEQLYKSLIGRRYLVILDDIWSVEAWDRVRHYFPDDGRSSRVVLTTRLSDVASACTSSCFAMKLLDEDKSWKLFCERALFPHKDDPLELEDVGKEIVRLCKGLALSIVVIGGLLLRSPRTIGHWENVAKDLESTHESEEKKHIINVLFLSYSHLPPHLKHCFLYMGSFREDSEIRVSTITRLWVAEGFIRPSGTRVLEEIAESFLKDLIDRNLIFVSRRRFNGNIGSCGIHDLLRDLCMKVAEEQDIFHVREDGEIRSTDRRIICDPNDRYIKSRLARSILTRSVSADSIKCKLLRVLGDAENTIADPPADVLYRNVNLRYLAYQNLYDTQHIWRLPISLTLMWNLQTLIVSPYFLSYQLTVAPSKIWRMQQLRHIKFPKLYLHSPSGREDVLENFQTLATAVNLKLSEKVCKIIPNINKLGLLYDHDLDGYDDSLVECLHNLDRLLNLESLKMKMDLGDDDYELHTKLAFPRSLRKLSLSGCGLHWNDLSMIGSLPLLHALHLEEYSVTEGKEWSPSDGQFRHLKSLKIDGCELYQWKADNSHFPVLEKLVLVGLEKLEEIPLDIGDISTLGLIRVEHCSFSAAISAMRIKEYQQDLGSDGLQVQIQIYESEVESFTKMVKTEQLSLNSIQFETY